MIKTEIFDGYGSGRKAKVDEFGEFNVVIHPHPPKGDTTDVLPFRSYFENVGSNDMTVNGATNSVDFSINASADYDIYIKSISLVIGDGGSPALNKFGALSALTNGVEWIYFNQLQGEYTLHEGIKTN
jgi:hypothetical protein